MNALIPARAGSKGIKNKNIIDIGGFPLIVYSIAVCDKCDKINKIFVSTDNSDIAQISLKYSGYSSKVVIPSLRPKEIATDISTDYDVLKHYFEEFCKSEDEVAFIRPTTPNRNYRILNLMIETYDNFYKRDCSGARSIHEIESVYKMFQIGGNEFCYGFFDDYKGNKNYTNLPRQSFSRSFHPNGYLDIVKQETIKKGYDFGDYIKPLITEKVLELDSKDDLRLVTLDLLNSELYASMKLL